MTKLVSKEHTPVGVKLVSEDHSASGALPNEWSMLPLGAMVSSSPELFPNVKFESMTLPQPGSVLMLMIPVAIEDHVDA